MAPFRTALCVGGRGDFPALDLGIWRQGQLWDPLAALEQFLRGPLAAQSFFFLSASPNGTIRRSRFDQLHSSTGLRVVEWDRLGPQALPQLEAELEAGHAANATWLPALRGTRQRPGAAAGAEEQRALRPHLFFLLLTQWEKCMRAVRQVEQGNGWTYTHVAFTRFDLIWLAQHPPLGVLDGARCADRPTVWALDGEEYSGVNDRHLLAERAAADAVAGLWPLFRSFEGVEGMRRWLLDRGAPMDPAIPVGPERLLLHSLLYLGACVQRMTSVASVVHASEDSGGDYVLERWLATKFAEIWHLGGRWEAMPEEAYLYGARCAGLPQECCEPDQLQLGGPAKCWWGPTKYFTIGQVYSLQRCCRRRHVDVTLRPPPKLVLEMVETMRRQPGTRADVSALAAPLCADPRWACLPWQPDWTSWWNSTWFHRLSIGSLLCYDTDRLLRLIEPLGPDMAAAGHAASGGQHAPWPCGD